MSLLSRLSLLLIPTVLCQHSSRSAPAQPSYASIPIDANAVIEPLLRPFSHMYDMMQENHKAMSYAEKIEQRRAESPLARSSGIFDLVDALQQTTTSTTTQSPLRQLLAPYFDPFERGMKMFEQEMKDAGLIPTTTTTTTPRPTTTPSILQKSLDMLFAPKKNADGDAEPGLFASMLRAMSDATAKTFAAGSASADAEEFRVKRRAKRQALFPPQSAASPFDLFDSMLGFNEPVALSNPFTPNPLVALFTTARPPVILPEQQPQQQPAVTPAPLGLPSMRFPSLGDSAFRMQDPFYNPLMPKRRNKVWDALEDLEKQNKKWMKALRTH